MFVRANKADLVNLLAQKRILRFRTYLSYLLWYPKLCTFWSTQFVDPMACKKATFPNMLMVWIKIKVQWLLSSSAKPARNHVILTFLIQMNEKPHHLSKPTEQKEAILANAEHWLSLSCILKLRNVKLLRNLLLI